MDNIIELSGSEKDSYLISLVDSLKKLSGVCDELNLSVVAAYCKKITGTLDFLRYTRGKEKGGIKEFDSLVINTHQSGFPNSECLRKLFAHREMADEYLARIPALEQIVAESQKKIYAGEFPEEMQEALVQRKFYDELKRADIAERREVSILEGRNQIRIKGFDLTKNLYVMFNFLVQQDKEEQINEDSPLFRYFDDACFAWNAREAFLKLNAYEGIRPQWLERFVIGPFYCRHTENTVHLQEVFNGMENPFLLRFRKESVKSAKSVPVAEKRIGLFKKAPVYKELCSDEGRDEYALCPHALRRKFEELFIKENNEFKVIPI